MKHNIKSLNGRSIRAIDGEIGKVKEFYFDDKTWTIRYLVVETGNWLFGRKVLISPQALLSPDLDNDVFPVDLTKEQIKNSPDIDTNKPVSRQHEISLYEYYPWANYWTGGLWGRGIGTTGMMMQPHAPFAEAIKNEQDIPDKQPEDDDSLRSTDKVTGYTIKATNGHIGDVEDFIMDDNTWKLDFIVVDTGNWFSGKKVLISPSWIKEIIWYTSTVIVNTSVDQVKNSPEYNVGQKISEMYEANLKSHYENLFLVDKT